MSADGIQKPELKITINGEEKTLSAELSVLDLLKSLNVPQVGIAVAVNFEVIKKQSLGSAHIHEGDRVEIIRAVQGG